MALSSPGGPNMHQARSRIARWRAGIRVGGRLALVAAGLAVAIVALAACDSSDRYPTNRNDDDYNLEAMSLLADDMPTGYEEADSQAFDNQAWAEVLDEVDPDAKKNQLDALGRIRSHIKAFQWPQDEAIQHLGEPFRFLSQSTLYVDEKSASESMKKLCDLPLDEKNETSEFVVSGLGDQSVGFTVSQQLDQFGPAQDVVICFRTGRIVHALSQTGLKGTADISLNVKLAHRWLVHIDDAFKSKPSAEPTEQKAG